MAKKIMMKPEKCIGCRTCELICSWNRGKDFSPRNSAISVTDYEEEGISVPMMCLQCEDMFCVKVCPEQALNKGTDGTVKVDFEKCIGCELCVSACPYGNISFNQSSSKIVKCELCEGDPGCVKYCPPGCLVYTEDDDGIGRKRAIDLTLKKLSGAKEAVK